MKVKITTPIFRYKQRVYVAGHITDVDPVDFDPCRMVKVEEPEKKETVILTEPLLCEPTCGDAQKATFGSKTSQEPEVV